MSILLQKGSAFSAEYTLTDYPVLTADWTGSISLYSTYPGTPAFTKAMIKVVNKLTLSLTINEILNLPAGLYSFVSTATNNVLGVAISSLSYATVSAINVDPATKCKLFGTILKLDGTPAGKESTTLANSTNGVALSYVWDGVTVSATLPVSNDLAGNVIGSEVVTTKTNASGYFELYVMQGLLISVACPVFGKTLSVDTTGLTEKDISTYF